MARAVMETNAENGMSAGPVPKQGSQGSYIGQHHMTAQLVGVTKANSGFSIGGEGSLSMVGEDCTAGNNWVLTWHDADFIKAHKVVKESGKFN